MHIKNGKAHADKLGKLMNKIIKSNKKLNSIKKDVDCFYTTLSYETIEKWATKNQLHLFIRRCDDPRLFCICSFDYLFSAFENDEFDTSDWDYSFNVFLQRWDYEILGNWSEDDV